MKIVIWKGWDGAMIKINGKSVPLRREDLKGILLRYGINPGDGDIWPFVCSCIEKSGRLKITLGNTSEPL